MEEIKPNKLQDWRILHGDKSNWEIYYAITNDDKLIKATSLMYAVNSAKTLTETFEDIELQIKLKEKIE